MQLAVEKILLKIFAQWAVRLKIKWPQAYDVISAKLLKKYRWMRSMKTDGVLLAKAAREAEDVLKQRIAMAPDLRAMSAWVAANIGLAVVYFFKGEYNAYRAVFDGLERTREDFLKVHQLDGAGIEFIPRAVATASIGVYECLNTYIMAQMLNWRHSKKLILLVDPKARVTNRSYLEYWSKYITIITDPKTIALLEPLETCLSYPFHYAIKLQEKVVISHTAIGIVQEQWDKENRPALLTLSLEDFNRGTQVLRSLGMPDNAWFVCLHVRESGWHEKSLVEDYRNANIDDYIPAIKSVVAAGGWVVRMGDSSMKPLPDMPQVIDYARSGLKSDWMDLFLSAQCRFVIGTSSGLFMVSVAFGVPVVVTNFLPTHATYCLSAKDLFLPGLCWSKQENRHLSFNELVLPPVGVASDQFTYDTLGLEVIKNSAEEINDVVEEMLAKCSGTVTYSDEDQAHQQRFKVAMAQVGKTYADENVTINSRIGAKFLRKYASLLPEGEAVAQNAGGFKSV